jgi:hypothetical protein
MVSLNLDRLEGETNTRVRRSPVYGAITGHIAVGRYVVQIGQPSGATIRDASPSERARFRPRPTPVLIRPRLIRGLVDRQAELAAILSALDAGLPFEVIGERGAGKTAILRHLAHHPRAGSFIDGVVYLPARHQSAADILQFVFEAFYEGDVIGKPTEAEILRGLEDKQALILLDDVNLAQDELERVLDCAPRSAFVVATRKRCLWGEVRSLALEGLPIEAAVLLLERETERSFDDIGRAAAERVCAALGGYPLRVQQAAAIAREQGIAADGWTHGIAPDGLLTELLASIDEKERRALLALTALPGVPLEIQDISGIAEEPGLESSLIGLAGRGLVVRSHLRYHLADGVGDRLRRTDDLNPWTNRAITYFTGWAERYRRGPDKLLEESEALLRAQYHAIEIRRWGEALRLGQLLEGALVVGARWGAWAIALDHCLAAAKTIGDRSAEAWALHEIGTRALCLGEPGKARASLGQALKLREALSDVAGAAASRRNLTFVPATTSEYTRDRTTAVLDLDSLPLRHEPQPAIPTRKTHRSAAVWFSAFLGVVSAALVYAAATESLPWKSWILTTMAGDATLPSVRPPSKVKNEPPGTSLEPPFVSTPPSPPLESANILIFTARPGSIAPEGRTALCYAVSGAFDTTIEPGIGEVEPTSTLTCHRVAPRRTTTYQLTAYGRDGHHVRQQLVIVVR